MIDQEFQLAHSCFPGRGRSSRGSRNAALATASASIGSDLPRIRRYAVAVPISFGGTVTKRSPAASSARSSDLVSCRQSSTAHNRSGSSDVDQATSSRPEPAVNSATERPTSSTATAVTDC